MTTRATPKSTFISFAAGFANGIISFMKSVLGIERLVRIYDHLRPLSVVVNINQKPITFLIPPRSQVLGHYLKVFPKKEPGTIRWLDTVAQEGVFFDVGANIGFVAVYLKLRAPTLDVWCFEPTYANFDLLRKNAKINGVNLNALPIALAAAPSVAAIEDPEELGGIALSINEDLKAREANTHPTMVDSLDALIEKGVPQPDYLKIDVDGIELEILRGAIKTLAGVREVAIEYDVDEKDEIIALLDAQGFDVSGDEVEDRMLFLKNRNLQNSDG